MAWALVLAAIAPASAMAGDAALTRAVDGSVARIDGSASAAAGRSPAAVQALYDAARDLEERARAAAPVSRRCRPLLSATLTYARGRVKEAEGVDRPSAAITASGRRAAARASRRIAAARRACRGAAAPRPVRALPISPGSEEAFYGPIVARAPTRARTARLQIAGRAPIQRRIRNGRVRFRLNARPGRYSLRVVFLRDGRRVGVTTARNVQLLPARARRIVPARAVDPAASARAAAALRPGPRFAAAWVQDLATGRAGAANAGARFPAASTVKLGLLAAGLGRIRGRVQDSPHHYDLRAMTRWSSNLATNRLLERLAGAAATERGLRALGARDSTFTGGYIVGTALQPRLPLSGADIEPPPVSRRVTTAQDLAHMMYAFVASAAGDPVARRASGLTVARARLALGWLLSSEQRLENASLLAGGAPRGAPIAQKNGWLRAARHGAGVIFAPSGARIVVVLTYDASGVSPTAGRTVGARVARVAAAL